MEPAARIVQIWSVLQIFGPKMFTISGLLSDLQKNFKSLGNTKNDSNKPLMQMFEDPM